MQTSGPKHYGRVFQIPIKSPGLKRMLYGESPYKSLFLSRTRLNVCLGNYVSNSYAQSYSSSITVCRVAVRASRLQPRRPRDLLDSPVKELLPPTAPLHQRPSPLPHQIKVPVTANLHPAAASLPISPIRSHPAPHLSFPTAPHHGSLGQELLLPPSSFMATHTKVSYYISKTHVKSFYCVFSMRFLYTISVF